MKVAVKLFAKLDTFNLKWKTPEQLADPEVLAGLLVFTNHPEGFKDYIHMGEVEVELEVITQNEMINGAIEALKEKQKALRAEAHAACTKIEHEIQQYLAIENGVSK